MPLTPDEQVEKINSEINQLKARKQAILNKEKQKRNKERAQRLIQYGEWIDEFLRGESIPPDQLTKQLAEVSRFAGNGELAEKYFECEGVSSEVFEKFLEQLLAVQRVKQNVEYIKKRLLPP